MNNPDCVSGYMQYYFKGKQMGVIQCTAELDNSGRTAIIKTPNGVNTFVKKSKTWISVEHGSNDSLLYGTTFIEGALSQPAET